MALISLTFCTSSLPSSIFVLFKDESILKWSNDSKLASGSSLLLLLLLPNFLNTWTRPTRPEPFNEVDERSFKVRFVARLRADTLLRLVAPLLLVVSVPIFPLLLLAILTLLSTTTR